MSKRQRAQGSERPSGRTRGSESGLLSASAHCTRVGLLALMNVLVSCEVLMGGTA